jgi:hypothetical protein
MAVTGAQITAVAAEGYYFVGWSDGVTTASRTDENITSDISVTATFALIDRFYVNLVSSPPLAGILSGEGEYADGTQAAVSAVANTGYTFINWNLNGVEVSEEEDYTFLVTENTTLTANFAINTYTLTYLADANGSISGTAVQTVNHGSDGEQVTAVANEGYHFP